MSTTATPQQRTQQRLQENVRIVLVDTSHAGNIGAAARAMKNMGLTRLYLVTPRQFPHADATARASGADDVLARATVCASLDEALVGCRLVMGASARLRHLSAPVQDPRQCATRIVSEVSTEGVECALVFGREHSGLTNDELGRCHFLGHIPTNADYSSLNLAAAVQVFAYELRMATLAGYTPETSAEGSEPLACADDMERFYRHLQQTLETIGFLDPANPRIMMRRLRRLFNRARPEEVEMNILRGILSAAQKHKTQ
ncbi:MAG TPA: tRNA (cytosine(32)/uridine(32)-2'-O)-methyltransferase TrmJ [Gammaproteobacteria bacterium]|nr:tRNA (cytosine(32)/uridine(32)-2'-O)-methyltransferase TrmJ [Gammaproteobacteria bacterium]